MRPEHLPQLFVAAFADQVQVELTKGRQVAVRVVAGIGLTVVGHLESVVRDLTRRDPGFPDAGVQVIEGDPAAVDQGHDAVGAGPHGPDHDAVVGGMHPEDAVRVVVGTARQPVQLFERGTDPVHRLRAGALSGGGALAHRPSWTGWGEESHSMLPTGICIQEGR